MLIIKLVMILMNAMKHYQDVIRFVKTQLEALVVAVIKAIDYMKIKLHVKILMNAMSIMESVSKYAKMK
jgi:hypothetical protein